ncbi:MAG: hypothetical protein CMJ78_11260 [Planctomycetaceae bacterium]|nr:hypothetical protein [Planctomycetaceae bacterium]
MSDPTPVEIQEACRQIRSSWDEREYQRRAGYTDRSLLNWLPPGPLRTLLYEESNPFRPVRMAE